MVRCPGERSRPRLGEPAAAGGEQRWRANRRDADPARRSHDSTRPNELVRFALRLHAFAWTSRPRPHRTRLCDQLQHALQLRVTAQVPHRYLFNSSIFELSNSFSTLWFNTLSIFTFECLIHPEWWNLHLNCYNCIQEGKHYVTARLLIEAGCDLKSEKWLWSECERLSESDTNEEDVARKEFFAWLRTYLSRPTSLRSLARKVIRNQMGSQMLEAKVNMLNVPKYLKEFLMLKFC